MVERDAVEFWCQVAHSQPHHLLLVPPWDYGIPQMHIFSSVTKASEDTKMKRVYL